jgi:hypothetical protein
MSDSSSAPHSTASDSASDWSPPFSPQAPVVMTPVAAGGPAVPVYLPPHYFPPGDNLKGTATFSLSKARRSIVRTITHSKRDKSVNRVAALMAPNDVSRVEYHDPNAPCIAAKGEAKALTDTRLDNIVVCVRAEPDLVAKLANASLGGPDGQTATLVRLLRKKHRLEVAASITSTGDDATTLPGGGDSPVAAPAHAARTVRVRATCITDGYQHFKVATEAFTLVKMELVLQDLQGVRRYSWVRGANKAAKKRGKEKKRGPLHRAGYAAQPRRVRHQPPRDGARTVGQLPDG